MKKSGTKDEVRFNIRVPSDLHRRIVGRAESNGRSMNAEIVAMFTQAFGDADEMRLQQLEDHLTRLHEMIAKTTERVQELNQRKAMVEHELQMQRFMAARNKEPE